MLTAAAIEAVRTWGRGFLVVAGLAGSVAGLAASEPAATSTADQPAVILVIGAAGEEEFGQTFNESADKWPQVCQRAGARLVVIGRDASDSPADLDRVEKALEAEPKAGAGELWLVLIGHGTFDGREAKFNLRGPDLTATNLAVWLKSFRRPLAVINAASASAPFLAALAASNRVVISATRSGHEQNYARFGEYFSAAVADPEADLDKDGQTSLLETFLAASRQVTEFYQTEGRLATEHALLDDNGDGLGTAADWFRGIRAVKQAREGARLDGLRAHQFHLVRSAAEQQFPPDLRARRDELELAIARLRETKAKLPVDDYYRRLEDLLVQMARLYESAPAPAQ